MQVCKITFAAASERNYRTVISTSRRESVVSTPACRGAFHAHAFQRKGLRVGALCCTCGRVSRTNGQIKALSGAARGRLSLPVIYTFTIMAMHANAALYMHLLTDAHAREHA